jgi:hypothetical protein
MVETSTSNCKDSATKLEVEATISIEKLNAKYIYESDFFNQAKIDAIVTEGYL